MRSAPAIKNTLFYHCGNWPPEVFTWEVVPSPLGAPERDGVSQGLGRSGGKGWNFVGFARKAEEA